MNGPELRLVRRSATHRAGLQRAEQAHPTEYCCFQISRYNVIGSTRGKASRRACCELHRVHHCALHTVRYPEAQTFPCGKNEVAWLLREARAKRLIA